MKHPYNEILRDIWFKHIKKEEATKEEVPTDQYRASGAGSCYLKHLYRKEGREQLTDRESVLKLRIGTLLHKDLEAALKNNENSFLDMVAKVRKEEPIALHTEGRIRVPDNNVIGHYDICIEFKESFDVLDFKFVHDFYWKKLFGRKENRDPKAGHSYELQSLTYARGLEDRLQKTLTNAYIIYGKKTTMETRVVTINQNKFKEMEKYWQALNTINKETIIPGVTYGCPFESWECNYCQYNEKGDIGGCMK
jgi:CRISPR/Cas system-associated exonuclease Cas4 (RecB family)